MNKTSENLTCGTCRDFFEEQGVCLNPFNALGHDVRYMSYRRVESDTRACFDYREDKKET